MAMLQVECLKKIYTTRFGGNQVQALSDVSFSVETGEYVAIMGESGSGKTTLLNILAALDQPTSGKVFLDGKDLTMVKEREIAAFRRDNLGFVFQDFNLLDTFSLKDNIFLPLVLAGKSPKEMELRLMPIAEQLGITHLLEKYPYEVSGGQKQRAAVARALNEKSAEDSIPALLEKQVQSSVYMEDTLRRLGELGVTEILEVGPGKALSGFVKKTLGPDVPCTAVETAEELAAFLTRWKEAHA